ncbi:hypothetical protein M885DRAFT_538057 [Pelagophyceae sp. CCMP2097]|nr:hypothetical protein M885DRAFT_538057 [Pelagophyceae sp. CCMP2097]
MKLLATALCATAAAAKLGGHATPTYLGVAQLDECLGEKQEGSATFHCLPARRPEACPEASWAALAGEPLDKCPAAPCLEAGATLYFADVHDGDQKKVVFDGTALTITPHGNAQQWVTVALLDPTFCNASVDFNVAGKPSPPPINITATVEVLCSAGGNKAAIGFHDPTGTLAAPELPVNYWIQIEK